MPSYKKSTSLILIFFFFLCGWSGAEEEELTQIMEEELPLEEALRLLDEVCPLPSWDEEPEPNPVSPLLPSEDEEPDYELLKSLHLEDKILEAEARIDAREFGEGPIDIEEYFSTRENMFIRDPERYLTSSEQRQLQGILTTHAGESSHNIHLNLLGKNDVSQIDSLTKKQHQEILAGDESGVGVYYFYDDPLRSVAFFSEQVKKIIPQVVREEMVSSAIHEASIQGDSYHAIYRFILDITLNIMNFTAEKEAAEELLREKERLRREKQEQVPLTEAPPSYGDKLVDFFLNLGIWPILSFMLAGISLIFLIALYHWNIRRRVHQFPIADIPHHLSFPRARGCSGLIQFGKSAPTLKEQQDKLFR